MSESVKLSHKLGLISALYICEGLPFGFFSQALPVLLRDAGLSLTEIGLTSLLAAPWALKFLWAPIVDRNYSPRLGQRKSWLLPIQALTIAVLIFASMIDVSTQMHWLFVAVFMCNLCAATLDIATDGLAVRLLNDRERGLGNGVQVGGYRVGMIISGGFLLIIFDDLGWSGSFLLMAALVFLLSIPVWRYKEPAAEPLQAAQQGKNLVWAFIRRGGVLPWLAAILVYKLGDALGAGMVKPFLVDYGLSLKDIGWLMGTLGFAASLLGALLGGALTSWLGMYRAMISFVLLQVVGILGYAYLAMNMGVAIPKAVLYCVIIGENLAGGMATAAIFTMMMHACSEHTEGTDYTTQASVFVVATGVAAMLSGVLAQHAGYTAYFGISAVAALLGGVPIMVARLRGGFRALS